MPLVIGSGSSLTYHRASQTACHKRKAQEQHQPRFPSNTIAGIAEAVCTQPRLVDRVDDEHAQRGADARDPVDEGNMDIRTIECRLGIGGSVDEEVEPEGELRE